MPDSGAEVFVPVTVSHTSTPQWQSFEFRMRHRKAERCVAHASEALSAGLLDEARAALDEARALAPEMPELLELERRLAAPADPQLPAGMPSIELFLHEELAMPAGEISHYDDAALPATDFPLGEAAAPVRHEKKDRGGLYARALVAAACLAFLAAGVVSWRQLTTGRESVATTTRNEAPVGSGLATEPAPLAAEPTVEASAQPTSAQPLETQQEAAAPLPEPSPAATSGTTESPTDRSAAGRSAPTSGVAAGRAVAAVPPPTRIVEAAAPTLTASREARASLPPVTSLTTSAPAPLREAPPAPRPPTIDAVPLATAELTATGSVPVSAPTAAPLRPRPAEPAPAPAIDPRAAVRAALARYEAAFSGLDAGAARAVWPSVDERALARAFDGLSAQRIALDRCDVTVSGATARAACSGFAEWTPKVGGGQRRQDRRWSFDLAGSAGAWHIVRADAR